MVSFASAVKYLLILKRFSNESLKEATEKKNQKIFVFIDVMDEEYFSLKS